MCFVFFFFNDTATTEIYTLSLHDALPIYSYWQPPSCILAQRIEIRNLEVAGSPHGRGEVPALCFRFRSMMLGSRTRSGIGLAPMWTSVGHLVEYSDVPHQWDDADVGGRVNNRLRRAGPTARNSGNWNR